MSALHTLARCCRDGIGVERDLQQAKLWLDRLIAVAPKDKSDYRHAVKLRKEMDEELL
jgi:TPR repeat protein